MQQQGQGHGRVREGTDMATNTYIRATLRVYTTRTHIYMTCVRCAHTMERGARRMRAAPAASLLRARGGDSQHIYVLSVSLLWVLVLCMGLSLPCPLP